MKMHLIATGIDGEKHGVRVGFTSFKVDGRTRQSKLAHIALAGFLEDVGGPKGLTISETLVLEDSAIAVARSRMLEEQAARGEPVPPSDVSAAAHLARKGRSAVQRIARRRRGR